MLNDRRPAVFLDRDGVINRTLVEDGVTRPPRRLEEFEFLPGVREATNALAHEGWPMAVVTNQPDVARGRQRQDIIEAMNDHVVSNLPVLEVFTCWHDSSAGCDCRKPKPGLIVQAAQCWGFDLKRSIMIGDRWSDILAGQAVGCLSILVETPTSGIEKCRPDVRVQNLAEAAAWIIQSFSRRGAA